MKKSVSWLCVSSLVSFFVACSGPPSKEDVCGACTGTTKAICEATYESCEDEEDCIEALDETNLCG